MKSKLNKQLFFEWQFVIWTLLNIIFNCSMISALIGNVSQMILKVSSLIIYAFCLFFFIISSKYKKNELLYIIGLIMLGLLSFVSTRSLTFVSIYIFVVSSKNIDVEYVLSKLFKSELIICASIVVLAVIGVIENKNSMDAGGVSRLCLGFVHPNVCGALIINLSFLYLYINRNKLSFKNYLFLGALILINILGPKSKTAIIIDSLLVVLVFFVSTNNYVVKKTITLVLSKLPLLLVLLSFCIIVLYSTNSDIAKNINQFLSSRVYQMVYFWDKYDVTFLGQPLEIVSSASASYSNEAHALDNAYMYLLLGYGLIPFVVFGYFIVSLVRKIIVSKDYYLIIIFSLMLLNGFMETTLFKIEFNSMLLFFSIVLFNQNQPNDSDSLKGDNHEKCFG